MIVGEFIHMKNIKKIIELLFIAVILTVCGTSSTVFAESEQAEAEEIKTKVSFAKSEYTIYFNKHKTIKARAVNASGAAVSVRYSSANKKIATVDKNGDVKGIKPGRTVITATATDGSNASAEYTAIIKKEKKGWHVTNSGKRYYILPNGLKACGYKKLDGKYYYIDEKTGYAVSNKWKYVNVDGKKYKLRFGSKGQQIQNVSSLIGKQKSYKIVVNTTKNIVTIYAKDGKNGYILPVKAMVCSCGIKGHRTITGNYSSLRRVSKWHSLYYGTYGKYCTRISGPYLFHSVVYSKYGDSYSLYGNEYRKLGQFASHGCIRLSVKDAKWIYDNASKCTVSLIKSNSIGPLLKPVAENPIKTRSGRYYDPTDPDIH